MITTNIKHLKNQTFCDFESKDFTAFVLYFWDLGNNNETICMQKSKTQHSAMVDKLSKALRTGCM